MRELPEGSLPIFVSKRGKRNAGVMAACAYSGGVDDLSVCGVSDDAEKSADDIRYGAEF